MSWKLSHKQNCKIHPSIANKSGGNADTEQPSKWSSEWMDLEVDRALSRWLQYWRSCFRTWTRISLDLANHPAERVMTHWYSVASSLKYLHLQNSWDYF